MSRNKDVREAAAETTHTAAERGADILEQVLEAISPLLSAAQGKATEAAKQVGPLADQAKDRLAPVADTAKERLAPVAGQAKDRIAPLADTAKGKIADTARNKVVPLAAAVGTTEAAMKAKDQIQPHLHDLAGKVQPGVDLARAKVAEELVPQIIDLLHQAENHPAVSEATKRSQAAAAALRGDLELPEKKERSVKGTVAKVAASGAVLAAVAVAVRQFLATKDDAWTAHQPSAAYVNDQASDDAASSTWVDATSTEAKMDAAETEPVPVADVISEDQAAQMSEEGGLVHDGESVAESLNVLNEYGEGSYVGDEPPAEYTIKGNERSMKYHTDDSAGYERTIADVWFNSVQAAEKAGFSRAQR